MNLPRLTDTTLRDGSHAMGHQFTRTQVKAVVQALDEAGVPVIEVTHGDGLAGSSLQYGFSLVSDMDLIEIARQTAQRSKIAALLLPGIGTRRELQEAVKRGVQVIRIATQCTEADVSEQHFGMAKELGLDTFKLMDAAEFVVKPMMPFQPFPDRDSIAIGYAGVYSTFLLHAKHASKQLGVDARDILVELGRRQAVAGQEDWILDVALDLARQKQEK